MKAMQQRSVFAVRFAAEISGREACDTGDHRDCAT